MYSVVDSSTEDRMRLFPRLIRLIADVPGSLVECGVYNGSSLSFLAALLLLKKQQRKIYGYDAFAPLQFGDMAASTQASSLEVVRGKLRMLGWEGRIELIAGLFSDTLPHHPDEPIALLHIDADYYESYRDVLNHLWHKVAPGGVVLLDEYASEKWTGAKKAVDEFLKILPSDTYRLVPGVRWYIHKQGDVLHGEEG